VRRRVRTDFELQDVADQRGISLEDAARDLALLAVMASIQDTFGDRVIFKGGSVLRFAWGATRTSADTDSTMTNPARTPVTPDSMREAIEGAAAGQFLQIRAPSAPATANKYSLDFDGVSFDCAGVRGTLSVETSYREDVQLEALPREIGDPYFDPFVVSTMRPVEMAAEKLRTLAQRARGTDLADCVLLERIAADELDQLAALRVEKFRLLSAGAGLETVIGRIEELRGQYEREVRALDPNAPSYAEACEAAQRLARRAW
jgi:predicted nucleotidyltransferase component of viral defense system